MVTLHIKEQLKDPRQQTLVAEYEENVARINRDVQTGKTTIEMGTLSNVPQFSISANFTPTRTLPNDTNVRILNGIKAITIPKESKIKLGDVAWIFSAQSKQTKNSRTA